MQSEFAIHIREAISRPVPTGRILAQLLRRNTRLIPYACRYLVNHDPDVRYVAADALFRISRNHRDLIARKIDQILRGLKYQDGKTRIKILLAIAPVVHEYPVRIERYGATLSHCLYNPELPSLRAAASYCLAQLAAIDDRRRAIYLPMLLQCIQKYRTHPDNWRVIRSLSISLRGSASRRYSRRIREVLIPLRRRGSPVHRKTIRRILLLTSY